MAETILRTEGRQTDPKVLERMALLELQISSGIGVGSWLCGWGYASARFELLFALWALGLCFVQRRSLTEAGFRLRRGVALRLFMLWLCLGLRSTVFLVYRLCLCRLYSRLVRRHLLRSHDCVVDLVVLVVRSFVCFLLFFFCCFVLCEMCVVFDCVVIVFVLVLLSDVVLILLVFCFY